MVCSTQSVILAEYLILNHQKDFQSFQLRPLMKTGPPRHKDQKRRANNFSFLSETKHNIDSCFSYWLQSNLKIKRDNDGGKNRRKPSSKGNHLLLRPCSRHQLMPARHILLSGGCISPNSINPISQIFSSDFSHSLILICQVFEISYLA